MRAPKDFLPPGGAASALFEALPMGAFLVDAERVVRAVNARGREFLEPEGGELVGARPGDALRCVKSFRSEKGCGHSPECGDCLLRDSADLALGGVRAEQREVRLTTRGAERRERAFLVSASPIVWGGQRYALLLLQDVTALHRLRGLLPICAGCKKIRREDQAWEAIEAFVTRHSLAEFTHGLCPECLERLYPEHGGDR